MKNYLRFEHTSLSDCWEKSISIISSEIAEHGNCILCIVSAVNKYQGEGGYCFISHALVEIQSYCNK